MEHDELDILRNNPVPAPRAAARDSALDAALGAYDLKNSSAAPQGRQEKHRLTDRAWRLWRETMNRKMHATPAIAALLALPIAGYTAYYLSTVSPIAFGPSGDIGQTGDTKPGDTKLGDTKAGDANLTNERRQETVVT